jgi:hypothetical protein
MSQMKEERDHVVPMVKARHDSPWRLSRGAPKEVVVRGELNAGHGPIMRHLACSKHERGTATPDATSETLIRLHVP